MAEQYQNLATTTNIASIDNTTNPFSIAIGSPTNFPSTTPYRITVCDQAGTNAEIMLVTGTSAAAGTTTLTATRGAWSATVAAQEAPTPTLSTHSAGSTLVHCITAGAMDQIRIDSQLAGSAASLPSSSKVGDIYLPIDGVQLFRSSSSGTFAPWGPLYPCTAPPSSGWTFVNQSPSGATDSVASGNDYLTLIKVGGNNPTDEVTAYVRPVIASKSFTLTVAVIPALFASTNTTFATAGLILTNGTTAAASFLDFKFQFFNSATGWGVESAGTFVGPTFTQQASLVGYNWNTPSWIRVVEDATHRTWYISSDGQNWIQVLQSSVTSIITTTHYGLFTRNGTTACNSAITLVSWKETNP